MFLTESGQIMLTEDGEILVYDFLAFSAGGGNSGSAYLVLDLI